MDATVIGSILAILFTAIIIGFLALRIAWLMKNTHSDD